MTNRKSYAFLGVILGAMTVTAFSFYALSAKANPLFFLPTGQTATATTSPAYITPGTATSTVSYDTRQAGQPFAANSSVLLVQFAGSSTASVLNLSLEYSQDGIDWYKDNIFGSNGVSTSTPNIVANTSNSISWTFASSTTGGGVVTAASGATSTKAFLVATPTRFVRVVQSLTGASGAVWSQFVPVRQAN